MKRYLVAAAALSLLGATSALAQDSGQRQWQGRQGQQQAQPQGRQQGAQTQPDWNAYMRNNPDLQRDYQQNRSRGSTESQQQYAERHWREHGQSEGRAVPQTSAPAWQGGQQGGDRGRFTGDRDNRGGQRFDNDRRGDQQRFDRDRSDRRFDSDRRWDGRTWEGRDYRRNWTARQRFRIQPYYRPRGWYYQRWTFGQILPQLFWGQTYWLDNYFAYGLPAPPPGTVWVHYGPDALLIDRYTGEIIQVVYNIFY